MIKFEVGKAYYMTSPCDHECRWFYRVNRRTAKSVWLRQIGTANVERKVISVHGGVEQVLPLGRYSMAPILGADRPSRPRVQDDEGGDAIGGA